MRIKATIILATILFSALLLEFPCRAFAENYSTKTPVVSSKTYSWQDKIKRGGMNIISSPVEIARQIQITSEEKNLAQGWTVGLLEGLGQGFLRFGAGVVDVVTCPFDFPKEQKAPLIEPEYVWEKPGVKYSS